MLADCGDLLFRGSRFDLSQRVLASAEKSVRRRMDAFGVLDGGDFLRD